MTNRVTGLACCAFLFSIFNISAFCHAATSEKPVAAGRLALLASAQFPNLTEAERSLLWFSDAMNIDRSAIAVAGPSSILPIRAMIRRMPTNGMCSVMCEPR